MAPYFTQKFGNPSSSHFYGQQAEGVLEECRHKVAHLLGAKENEVIFTGSGSEGDNLAIRGLAFSQKSSSGRDTILISPVEHPAVMNTARQLHDRFGFKLIEMRIDEFGKVNLDDLKAKIDRHTAVVSVIYANNEIGTINPISQIADICHDAGVPFHSDAVQACGYLPLDVTNENIDLLTIAAHKFYGPKGAAAMIKRENIGLLPVTTGGKQEDNLRSGTQNIPGIVGLTAALEITSREFEAENKRIVGLRDKIIHFVLSNIPESHLTGHPTDRLPNHASFVFDGVNGNDLIIMLDMVGFACSSGSACKVGDPKPSEVLLALGLQPELAIGSLRVTLGKYTSEDEIARFLEVLPGVVKRLRK